MSLNEDFNIKKILETYPLRISLTNFCNLGCFFCSNEGMESCEKNNENINVSRFKKFIDILFRLGLKNISITGGDPTMHPEIKKILKFINKYKFKNFIFHTNGVLLNKEIVDLLLKNCQKIAISIHSTDFLIWSKMTGGNKKQFNKLLKNLEYLSSKASDIKVEIKLVILKGMNDSDKNIKIFLDFCKKNSFAFKVLNFEPINRGQFKFCLKYKDVVDKFVKIGCKEYNSPSFFRGQNRYLPYKKYIYKNTNGVIIEIRCGDKKVCKECYLSNEIFVNPSLKIKPCHIDNKIIDLNDFIMSNNIKKIKESIVYSRKFLKRSPGAGFETWSKK